MLSLNIYVSIYCLYILFVYVLCVYVMFEHIINSSRSIFWEVVVCSEKSTELGVKVNLEFTWSLCTWSRPWFPRTRRAWPIHRGGADELRFGSPGR